MEEGGLSCSGLSRRKSNLNYCLAPRMRAGFRECRAVETCRRELHGRREVGVQRVEGHKLKGADRTELRASTAVAEPERSAPEITPTPDRATSPGSISFTREGGLFCFFCLFRGAALVLRVRAWHSARRFCANGWAVCRITCTGRRKGVCI